MSKSQISNELAFEELCLKFLGTQTYDFRSVQGFRTERLDELLIRDSTSSYELSIADPQINYQNLEGSHFRRTIEVEFVFTDTTDHSLVATQTDTLHKKSIPQARKSEYKLLRGPNPLFRSRILWPAVMIGAGISGIISLFYIRSS